MRIILIGEAPPRRKRGVLDYEIFRGLRCERVNLLKRWRGRSGKGSRFPLKAARRAAKRLLRSGALEGKLAVFVGKRAAAAFGRSGDYFSFVGNAVAVPHPSGVNHWWNDRGNRIMAKRFLLELRQCLS